MFKSHKEIYKDTKLDFSLHIRKLLLKSPKITLVAVTPVTILPIVTSIGKGKSKALTHLAGRTGVCCAKEDLYERGRRARVILL